MNWTDNESSKTAQGFLNRVSGVTLWEEMVRDRKEFCLKQCQNNKVVNMLRPKCTERRYLDVLLLKREPKKGMPMFCYSQRVKELTRSFKEGHTLLADVYVYIDDFYSIIHEKHSKSRRAASDLLKRSFSRKPAEVVGSQDYLIETHYVRGMLFILWPKLDLCLVNAQDTSIHSLTMFQSIAEILAESFALEVEMESEGNFIELRFANLTLTDSVIIEEKLQMHSAFTGYSGNEVWAEVHLPTIIEEEEHEFRVKDLHSIFQTVAEVTEIREVQEGETGEKEAEEVPLADLSEELDT
ncbi:MAG: hypothetical protein ACFFFG_03155 [Candidatus Thorarchaeota archaeon]